MRTLEHIVEQKEAGLRIQLVLKRNFGLSEKQIRRLKFLNNGITVNGLRCRTDYTVSSGDYVRVTFSDQNRKKSSVVPISRPLHILYEDEDLLILDKAAGEICHPSHGHHMDTLSNQVAAYLSEIDSQYTLARCIGRLDKDTSGGLVFAKNQFSARELALQKEAGSFYKEYLALVNGSFSADNMTGEICLPISRDPDSLMKMQVSSNGKEARTVYHVLCSDRNCSLVCCRIFTGRTHQIRVHMAAIGHPLVGDPLYGKDRCISSTRTALHAWKIHFRQPVSGLPVIVESFHSQTMFC